MNKFLSNSLIYGGLSVLSRFTGIITAPILTSILTVAEFGTIDVLGTSLAILILLVSLNLNSGLFRIYHEKEEHEKKTLLTSVLVFYLVIGFILTAIVILFADFFCLLIFENLEYKSLVLFYAFRLPFQMAFQQFISLLRIKHNAKLFAIFTFSSSFFQVLIVVVLYYLQAVNLYNLTLYQTLVYILLTVLLGLVVIRDYAFKIDFPLIKEVMDYSLPQIPSVAINFVILSFMPILLTKLASLYDTGIYSIANKLGSLYGISVYAFRMAYDPMIMEIMSKKSLDRFKYISKLSFDFYLVFLYPMLIFVYYFPYVFNYLIDEKFNPSLDVFHILCFAVFLSGVSNIIGIGINYSKKTKYISYAQTIVLVVFLIMAYPLVAYFGFTGAVYLYFTSVLVQNMSMYIFSKNLLNIEFDLKKFIALSLVTFGLLTIKILWIQIIVTILAGVYTVFYLKHNAFLQELKQEL